MVNRLGSLSHLRFPHLAAAVAVAAAVEAALPLLLLRRVEPLLLLVQGERADRIREQGDLSLVNCHFSFVILRKEQKTRSTK